jgi:hypothetical protein
MGLHFSKKLQQLLSSNQPLTMGEGGPTTKEKHFSILFRTSVMLVTN